jgi:predicted GIY-YIG superfamily endonuclease
MAMVIYSLRDASGRARYVGVSKHPKARAWAHKARFPDLRMVVLMQGLTCREASELEIALIAKLNENQPQLLNVRT